MYAKFYKDNPTSGGTDGTQVSEGTGLFPIVAGPVNATENEESTPIKLAVRTYSDDPDKEYATEGDGVIEIDGINASKWSLAPDNSGSAGVFGAYGASLTISSAVEATNTIFWAKAKATNGEDPQNDVGVDLKFTAKFVEV